MCWALPRTVGWLRVLYHNEVGPAQLKALQWKSQLGAWVQGHDDQGRWSDGRVAAAHRTAFAAQAVSKDLRKAAVQTQKQEAKAGA